ncbi:hypothetical protein HA402_002948 [Bradysia odoriphaga]|nr:hypothetical protein HA402_002948 [Bradysia odoriphaga]
MIKKMWPKVSNVWVGSDLETALACVDDVGSAVKAIVVAGTGSCCYGTNGKENRKIGGYGHRIGDRGSAYGISENALRLALHQHERNIPSVQTNNSEEIFSNLLSSFMKRLGLHSLKQLVQWTLSAKKNEIADLAPLVLLSWKQNDELAQSVIEGSIDSLSDDLVCLVGKLNSQQNKLNSISVGLTGSLFSKDICFAKAFQDKLHSKLAHHQRTITVSVEILQNTALGSLRILDSLKWKVLPLFDPNSDSSQTLYDSKNSELLTEIRCKNEKQLAQTILPIALGLSLTEKRNEKSMNLDKMDVEEAIDLMVYEDRSIFGKISESKTSIRILVEEVCRAFQNGGRLFYVGAGTSGRLGILDASECPPTFRSPHEWVQGIIAGGFLSIGQAKEGAEDSILDGIKAINERNVNDKDVVIGIAACGTTPFVWGSIYRAKSLNAFTAFLTFNTELQLKIQPNLFISMDLGPEVLTGSTRLKCGTATKCILNMVSTLAMVKYGKCFENLMVDLNAANEKLKKRSLRIVLLLTSHLNNVNEKMALEVLVKNKYDIRETVSELRTKSS